jgi:hypothetical protein
MVFEWHGAIIGARQNGMRSSDRALVGKCSLTGFGDHHPNDGNPPRTGAYRSRLDRGQPHSADQADHDARRVVPRHLPLLQGAGDGERPRSYPLTLYHLDDAALARCTALIANPCAATTAIERMAARLLASVCQPSAAECTKGRFFDRASEKLRQLARFDSNELVSVDLQSMAAAMSSDC